MLSIMEATFIKWVTQKQTQNNFVKNLANSIRIVIGGH